MRINLTKSLVTVAVCAATALVAAPPAQAASAHCPIPEGAEKVETDGAGNTVQTDLEPGTVVCVKAGNRITYVTVAEDGTITQRAIGNINGMPLGISYYVAVPCTQYSCYPY